MLRLLTCFTVFAAIHGGFSKTLLEQSCQYEHIGDQCLFFANFAEEPQENAIAWCNGLGGRLVKIKTATQMKNIAQYLLASNSTYSGSFWVDGSDAAQEDVWVYSSGELMPFGTPFWGATSFQRQPSHNGNCATINEDIFYYINDQDCDDLAYTLCEMPFTFQQKDAESENIVCPPPYQPFGSMCLTIETQEIVSWEEGLLLCQLLSGSLAFVNDVETLRDIYMYLHQEGLEDYSFWLGGSEIAHEGYWTWNDGSPVPMGTPFWGLETWSTQEPNVDSGNCLGLQASGWHYFRDVPCHTSQYPICMPL
ncbi:hypothetical protein SK128_027991 [Halocaridina rubra]|uniref:C-type lectin domain-containing protein n=1 Tax=Halocaridina rubra TaxID=373956 RepID=A0AAN8ZWW0_HALRR